ncbi:hypothetical protein [Glycomyces albidus]|uniref:PPE domain-containing protein n=1 Tax=Glycomyces albidus TaxID=2656774 RepID=A0A6L5GFM3_9ACTN|nr:hypothetical protein [Glycomyces albidus]MQM28524.1 hypothetical protein [Glycomyces albidus]
MSFGQEVFDLGDAMAPACNGVIKTCAVGIAPPAIAFGLSVQALATSIYLNQCNPGDLMKAGGAWILLAEKNFDAADALEAETATVNDDNWSGTDATAFREASGDVGAQLREMGVMAYTVGLQLMVFAGMFAAYWAFLSVVTLVMDAYLIAYLAALAGVLTAPGAPAIMASAQATGATLLATTKTIEKGLQAVAAVCAGLLGSFTAFTLVFQKAKGNPVSPLDIAGAGFTNIAEGLLVYAVNAFTMTPGGKHALSPLKNPLILGGHLFQAGSPFAPTYQGDGEWNGGYDGGGPAAGAPDSLMNWWEDVAPPAMTNPEEVDWR